MRVGTSSTWGLLFIRKLTECCVCILCTPKHMFSHLSTIFPCSLERVLFQEQNTESRNIPVDWGIFITATCSLYRDEFDSRTREGVQCSSLLSLSDKFTLQHKQPWWPQVDGRWVFSSQKMASQGLKLAKWKRSTSDMTHYYIQATPVARIYWKWSK